SSAQRVKDAIVAIQRMTNSRRLDTMRAERSGVPLGLVATGGLYQVVEWGPLRAASLAERSRMQPAALSRQLGILERAGLIERARCRTARGGSVVGAAVRGGGGPERARGAADALFPARRPGWDGGEIDRLAELLERRSADRPPPTPAEARAPDDAPARRRPTG